MSIEANMIARMTSAEITAYIMGDAAPNEPVAMSQSVAEAIIEHPCYDALSDRLKDWAWDSIDVIEAISDGSGREPKIIRTFYNP